MGLDPRTSTGEPFQPVQPEELGAAGPREVFGQEGRGASGYDGYHPPPVSQLTQRVDRQGMRSGRSRVIHDRGEGAVEVDEHTDSVRG